MHQISEYFQLLLNSEQIIRVGGLALLTFIVFAETGIFFCFFFPGDYLLFTAGLLAAPPRKIFPVELEVLLLALFAAAVAGNLVGFLFGRYLGHKLETMRESIFFKRSYIQNTRDAFAKYGGRALIVGRFLPVIRTFAPILAGASEFKLSTFLIYNLAGGALWVVTLTSAGYFLGREFPQIVNYVEYIILAFIAFTTVVLIRSLRQVRADARAKTKIEVDENALP